MNKQVAKLNNFFKENHRMPSYGEMMKLFSYKTKSAVDYLVKKMVVAGYISKDKTGKIIPKKLFDGIRMLGLVEAGFPSPAEEELVDTMNLEDYLISNKDASYILSVKGDSMIDVGIYEGDMVIVERGTKPKNGDIVIANVDGEFTMKFLRSQNGRSYLEPANKNYSPIFPKNSLDIIAVVKVIIRKL